MPGNSLEEARFDHVSDTGELVFVSGAGKFAVKIDEALERAILEAKQIRSEVQEEQKTRIPPTLPISQIQSLIRAGADPARVAAVGFCFGGLTVLDLARSGADVAGVVSLHGVFTPPGLPAQPIKAEVLVCHGWDDPLCPPEAFTALAKELTEAGCAWRAEAYGHTGHSFTDPETAQGVPGFGYSPAATAQAFTSTTGFLERVLG